MALDNDRMLLSEGYSTTRQLVSLAAKDADQVSAFVNGNGWKDADCAIFIVKGGEHSKRVFDLLEQQGLISRNGVAS